MLNFYRQNNFKLFKCYVNKSPDLPKNSSWRDASNHLSIDNAEQIIDTGGYVGAWLPENYLIIDIDVKGEKHKHDGVKPFQDLCLKHGIEEDLMQKTLVVKTGSGGFHLYFKLPDDISYTQLTQKSLIGGLDIRTHLGYIIAAGTNGYSVINQVDPILLPTPFIEEVKRNAITKAEPFNPEKALPIKELKSVLGKLDIHNYDTNDTWQEFVTSVIATCGNSPEVLDILETWSQGDESYITDSSIRARLETFSPDGGITAGTFLYSIKNDVSKYLYNKIRVIVGKEFTFSKNLADNFDLPFKVDYTIIHTEKDLMSNFYYTKHQAFGANLFANLVKDSLIYVQSEKCYFYFNGTYWVEAPGIQQILFTAFIRAGLVFYTDFSEGKDDDSSDLFNDYINFLGSLSMLQKFEQNIRQHPLISVKDVNWDTPDNAYTLTLQDSVLDFSRGSIEYRPGTPGEYRRLFMNMCEKDFKNTAQPEKFKEFLSDIFPNKDTRKTVTYALSTMLSGSGKFRKFQIWNGSGNNGKSALTDIMCRVLGSDKAIPYTPDSMLSSDNVSPLTPELAQLRGALLAFSSETNAFKKISEGAVKRITGDEPITANPKFQKPIHFHTTWQTVLSTNNLPEFSSQDIAYINRLLILPFHAHFYENEDMRVAAEKKGSRYFKPASDPVVMKNEILKERPGIILYLAKRLLEIDKTIPESEECLEAKRQYIKDNNSITELITDMLEEDVTKNWFTPTKDLVDFYNDDQNVKYSSKFILHNIKLIHLKADNGVRTINGKLARGLKNIRLIYGAYPEGYAGNFTQEESETNIRRLDREQKERGEVVL